MYDKIYKNKIEKHAEKESIRFINVTGGKGIKSKMGSFNKLSLFRATGCINLICTPFVWH